MAHKLLNLDTGVYEWVLSEKEYEELTGRDDFLSALEAAGVDNWEHYSDAYRILEGEDIY